VIGRGGGRVVLVMVGDCRADGKWLMWCGCSSRGVCGSVVEINHLAKQG